MVSAQYLVEKPATPPWWRTFFNQNVIPVAIDAAGTVEIGAEFLAVCARRHPVAMLATAFGLGLALGGTARRR